jgi:hypothetical protein
MGFDKLIGELRRNGAAMDAHPVHVQWQLSNA